MITTMKFAVTGQRIELTEPVMLVAETVHIYTASFVFNSTWDGYTKTAVFRGGDVEREQLLTDDSCEVPWEVLLPGAYLKVGVYGTRDGIRLPTIWTERTQYINAGAGPTEEAAEPSPTLVEQLTAKVGNLDALKTEDKSSLVAAVNELQETGGGGVTSDHSKLKNRDAADQHPMSAITGLEKALEGKQPTGSYLTDKDLDTTLTVNGKAADAKAVGDALRSLSEEMVDYLPLKGGIMAGKIIFPAGLAAAGISNDGDIKIFGYGAYNSVIHMRLGDTMYPLQLRGSNAKPKYNDTYLLTADDTYTKEQIEAALGAYITDIDTLIGGDA